MPVCGRGDVEQDGKGGSRFISRVKQSYVRDVASQGHLPVVQIVEGCLILQFQGQSVGYLLKKKNLRVTELFYDYIQVEILFYNQPTKKYTKEKLITYFI